MRRKKEYVPRDPIRDYFPLPNEIFSLGLSTGEIAVYAYLMYCEDRETFQCHPSYSTNRVGQIVKQFDRAAWHDVQNRCQVCEVPA